MQYQEIGLGFFQWAGEDVLIAGGIRCHGFHPPGQMRMAFVAYGVPEWHAHGEDAARLGRLELIVNQGTPPTVDALVVLTIDKGKRRQGHGSRVVAAVREAAPADLRIYDIRRSALGFWRGQGIEFPEGRPPARGKIDGVLRRSPAPGHVEPSESPRP